MITALGVKPLAPVQWPRKSFWIYGVVEPLSGWYFQQEYEHLDSQNFQSFLDAVSKELGEDMALLQMDGAGAHISNDLIWPTNIIPVQQPAHSPELNPIERLWEWIKSKLKGDNFASLDELREFLKEIWESLSWEQVSSLTCYDFILEALFYAAS